MQTEKQKWVDDVLNCTDGISPATTPDMSDTIMSSILTADRYSIKPSNNASLVWRIAASVTLLLVINAVTIYSYQSNMKRSLQAQEASAASSVFGLGQSIAGDPGSLIFGN